MRENLERESLGNGPTGTKKSDTSFPKEVGRSEGRSKKSGYLKELDKTTISFFFTNFLDHAKNTDLWRAFAEFGYVGELFVPHKVDRWGRRFSFMKYKEVVPVEGLEAHLRDVWLWDMKLKVNLARFGREEKKGGVVQPKVTVVAPDGRIVLGKTYKAVTAREQDEITIEGE